MSRAHASFIPPAPPKTPKSASTRVRLIEAAADLFLEFGYGSVSMQDIADKANITKGGVYGHFRSKGQLLVEVIHWKHAEREHSEAFVDALQDPDRAVGLLLDDTGHATRLLTVDAAAAARHDPDIAAGMGALERDRHSAIGAALEGVVSDPHAMAWLVSALSMGIGMLEALASDRPTLSRLDKAIREWVYPPRES